MAARELLFTLTRQQFTPAHRQRAEAICQTSTIDWNAIARMAAREGVAPIVGVNLALCDPALTGVPGAVSDRLQQVLFENVALKIERREHLLAALTRLHARGYDILVLKSAALELAGVAKIARVPPS